MAAEFTVSAARAQLRALLAKAPPSHKCAMRHIRVTSLACIMTCRAIRETAGAMVKIASHAAWVAIVWGHLMATAITVSQVPVDSGGEKNHGWLHR